MSLKQWKREEYFVDETHTKQTLEVLILRPVLVVSQLLLNKLVLGDDKLHCSND